MLGAITISYMIETQIYYTPHLYSPYIILISRSP